MKTHLDQHQLRELVDVITWVLNSGTLNPESETKFLNAKKTIEEALKTIGQQDEADTKELILGIVKIFLALFNN